MRLEDVSPVTGPGVPPTPEAPLARVLTRGREHLFSLARADGTWCGALEGSPRLDAEYLMLRWFLGHSGGDTFTRVAAHLAASERADGGWADFPGGPASVDATALAHLALVLARHPHEAPHLERARHVIRALGGLDALRARTKLQLALLGQWEWDDTPRLWPEVLLLPPTSSLGLFGLAPWARTMFVPLSVLSAKRPVRPVPVSASLALGRGPRAPRLTGVTRAIVERGLGDGAPLRSVRRLALLRAEAWILEHAEPSDGLGGTTPATCAGIWALTALGYRLDHPVMARLLRALEDLAGGTVSGGTVYGGTGSPGVLLGRTATLDTALALRVACALPGGPRDPRVTRGLEVLLAREVRRLGDWSLRAPGVQPSGWSRREGDELEPDVVTTALVLDVATRLARAEPERWAHTSAVRQRALRWLLAMQSPDGGWSAFEPATKVSPFATSPHASSDELVDRPCPSITGIVLEALATTGLDGSHAAVGRALAFLRSAQAPDGAWPSRWGVTWIHGTAHALCGLAAIGAPITEDAAWARARDWLVARQRSGGGFGEAASAERRPGFVPAPPTVTQTAWALRALVAARAPREVLDAAARHLVEAEAPEGGWSDDVYLGTAIPGTHHVRPSSWATCYALFALAEHARA